ncbi:F-type H+-transporting ATPase subunit gamma [Thermotomaculum hydrothermale]|uniref:ATP synthase gamma chain n=1 Tax=Thermotomaculum hydrothermale TaxID=981385 RepID=A0A7R6PZD5_9BACT|nr:ATP synthase F1 subunit gamma [Thermotomaculum hydrothermale]BBB32518.1 F-type H+-transporting ATPase subunit gamma [Thermotomaculum hydrothermale]
MAAIHILRRRIKSVKNTRQITRAMKLVAAAKMKKAQERVYNARPYARKLQEMIQHIASRIDIKTHPLLEVREEKKIKLVVVTADRGLCGAFNANVIKRAMQFLDENKDSKEVYLEFVGRKGFEFFKKKWDKKDREVLGLFNKFDSTVAEKIAEDLLEDFIEKRYDAIYFVYNEFKSVLQQNLVVEKLLPIEHGDFSGEEKEEPLVEHIFEPSIEEVLNELLPLHIKTQVYRVLIESNAAEFAARMTAMDAATNNATEMIDKLTLTMNKIRQAAITKEIIEVVSGAEVKN